MKWEIFKNNTLISYPFHIAVVQYPKVSTTPVLMLTAIADEYTQVMSFDEQADDYITKPFSMVLLGKRITALLRRSGQTAPLSRIF